MLIKLQDRHHFLICSIMDEQDNKKLNASTEIIPALIIMLNH